MKNNKGITLIALVVTIIVLLILAGVSIAMLTGDNGILSQARVAKTSSVKGNLDEAAKIAVGNILATKYATQGWPYDGKTDVTTAKSEIATEIKAVNSNIKDEVWGENPTATDKTTYKFTAKVDGSEQSIVIDLATGAVTAAD